MPPSVMMYIRNKLLCGDKWNSSSHQVRHTTDYFPVTASNLFLRWIELSKPPLQLSWINIQPQLKGFSSVSPGLDLK